MVTHQKHPPGLSLFNPLLFPANQEFNNKADAMTLAELIKQLSKKENYKLIEQYAKKYKDCCSSS